MKQHRVITPFSTKSFATSEHLRMFSSRSAFEKPKSQHRPCRKLSPSRRAVSMPRSASKRSTSKATVDFPDPLRPVNQTTQPFCFRIASLAERRTPPAWKVTFGLLQGSHLAVLKAVAGCSISTGSRVHRDLILVVPHTRTQDSEHNPGRLVALRPLLAAGQVLVRIPIAQRTSNRKGW